MASAGSVILTMYMFDTARIESLKSAVSEVKAASSYFNITKVVVLPPAAASGPTATPPTPVPPTPVPPTPSPPEEKKIDWVIIVSVVGSVVTFTGTAGGLFWQWFVAPRRLAARMDLHLLRRPGAIAKGERALQLLQQKAKLERDSFNRYGRPWCGISASFLRIIDEKNIEIQAAFPNVVPAVDANPLIGGVLAAERPPGDPHGE